MKRFILIVSMLFVTTAPLFAQEEDDNNDNETIREKMTEYIEKRLDLSKDESSKFVPVFIRYFKEWRQTYRLYRNDKLVLQQKIINLRLAYRPHFREIMGERRGDQVFNWQERFIAELRAIQRERRLNNPDARPLRRR